MIVNDILILFTMNVDSILLLLCLIEKALGMKEDGLEFYLIIGVGSLRRRMKSKCKHDWSKWGEPFEVKDHYTSCETGNHLYIVTKQSRECIKCGLQEVQRISCRDDR
jgi:hypothetical protein